MVSYRLYNDSTKQVKIGDGFFEGWPNPPGKEKHREILARAYKTIVAVDEESNQIIGFIYAISDGVLSAYIPMLEVLPQHRNEGIGSRLVEKMLEELKDFYMVDLCCDERLGEFYERLGMKKSQGMIYRNYASQSGIG